MLRHFRLLAWFMAVSRVVIFRPFARFFSPLMGWPPGFLARTTTVKDGMTGPILRRSLVNLVENSTGGVIGQFISWTKSDGFKSRDGELDYLANLERARKPALIMAADKDYIAPPDTVIPAYQRLGAEDKQLRIFGTDRGDDHDFGHADLLLGRYAKKTVYPEVAEWLEARATSETNQ
jgi:pimeloyl-ACP methyl ester carboxylesterase